MTFLEPTVQEALWLSIRLSTATTVSLVILVTPLALWLSRSRSTLAILAESITTLPLVLPPVVLGFYILWMANPEGAVGRLWKWITHQDLVFSFSGLLLGSIVYSLPFVLRPILIAFSAIDSTLLESATLLQPNRYRRFLRLILPLAKQGYLYAIVLGFTHTLGEFGMVLMLGGNMAGETRTLSIVLYEEVEQGHYREALYLSMWILVASLVALALLSWISKKNTKTTHPKSAW